MFFKRKTTSTVASSSSPEPSYIARDTTFEGNIICDGEIHIEGALRGSVRAHTCLVDAHGEVHGEVMAQHIYIRGRVMGPISGANVNIQAGAHVEGNITHESISIENGAYVYGSMRQGGIAQPHMNPSPQSNMILEQSFEPNIEIQSMQPLDNVRPIKSAKT